jgi:hypothetical protein
MKKASLCKQRLLMASLKLKLAFVTYLIVLLGITSCKPNKAKELEKRTSDSLAITQTVTNFYKWEFEQSSQKYAYLGLFDLLNKDSIYTGVDFDSVKKNVEMLESIGLLDSEFLVGYKLLADKIDEAYKKSTEPFRIDDGIPLYGSFDYDIFYNSQDMPDEPFASLIFDSLTVENNRAEIWWGWKGWEDDKVRYYVKLRLDNDKWKITNLMGFDQELKTNYIR